MNPAHVVFLAKVSPAIWFAIFFPVLIMIVAARKRRKGGP